MGNITTQLANQLLDHVCNSEYSPEANVFLALSTADPTSNGLGLAEPSGNGYTRKDIDFSASALGVITQTGVVSYGTATGSWGEITHWAVCDSSGVGTGNALAVGALSTPKNVIDTNDPRVDSGEVYVEMNSGFMSYYLADNLLDLTFRNQAYSAPATYVALTTADIVNSDTGSTITEPAGGSAYARELVNVNGQASPTWTIAQSGALTNSYDIDFDTPTNSWSTIEGICLVDALSGGNMLFYDNSESGETPDTGDPGSILAGAFDISLG